MMRFTLREFALGGVVAALAATAACSSPDATAPVTTPTPEQRATTVVAAAAAHATASEVGMMQLTAMAFGMMGQPRRAAAPAMGPAADITYGGLDCTYSDVTQRFSCPEMTLASMTISANFALLDGAGAAQSAYDDNTTQSADIVFTAYGDLVNPPNGATIQRARHLTVSGLSASATERTFGGSGTDVANGTETNGDAWTMHDTTTATTVRYAVPFSSNVWPLGGTLTTDSQLDVTPAAGAPFTTHRHVAITFNGTQFVPMVVGTTTYTLDLGTGDITTP